MHSAIEIKSSHNRHYVHTTATYDTQLHAKMMMASLLVKGYRK